jgi:hypothetical protein
MLSLCHWLYAPALLYGGIGLLVLRQGLRPSCRVCLHRHRCPNRLRGPARFVELPVCVRRSTETRSPKA